MSTGGRKLTPKKLRYKGAMYILSRIIERVLSHEEFMRADKIVKKYHGEHKGRHGTSTEFEFVGEDTSVDGHVEQAMDELESSGFKCNVDLEDNGESRVWALYVWSQGVPERN